MLEVESGWNSARKGEFLGCEGNLAVAHLTIFGDGEVNEKTKNFNHQQKHNTDETNTRVPSDNTKGHHMFHFRKQTKPVGAKLRIRPKVLYLEILIDLSVDFVESGDSFIFDLRCATKLCVL